MSSTLTGAVAAAVLALVSLPPTVAVASGAPAWDGRATISGAVLPEACQGTRSESSPQLVRHPDEPERLTATFLTEGTLAVGVAASRDGGRTWVRSALSPAARCSGGRDELAVLVNPQLAAGPAGAAYFGNSWLNGEEEPLFRYGVAVHGAADPRSDWSAGTSPGRGDYAQNVAVVADAERPGVVTAIWTHMDQVPVSNLGPIFYAYATSELLAAVSTDGGRSFGLPRLVAAEPGRMIVNVRAERLEDGTLLAAYDSVPVTVYAGAVTGVDPVFRHSVVRSADGGRTWTDPAAAGERRLSQLADPDGTDGAAVAGSFKFHLATGPDDVAAIVWAEPASSEDVTAIRLTLSRDGGATWGPARTVLERRGGFQPAVAFDDRGRLGVVFYDWSRDVPGDAALTTDVWLATSTDATSWRMVHLDGPMDLRQARREGLTYDGLPIGVYQDLVGLADGFGAAYTVAPPAAADGGTDVRFRRWTAPSGSGPAGGRIGDRGRGRVASGGG